MRADPRLAWATSFGSEAERYDRARPRYPEAVIERILAESPGPDVLDVGCGTGIVARQLRAAGARVLGVDVDPEMAAVARRDGLEVEVSAFENWDAAGRSFDAVVAGQTWHWIDAGTGAAKALEVLRPHGRLTLLWNLGQPPAAVTAAFAAVYHRVEPGLLAGMWDRPALDGYAPILARTEDGIRSAGGLGEPERSLVEWDWHYTRAAWLDQLPTFGGHSRLPPAQLEELLEGIGAALGEDGFTMRYTTVVVAAERRERGRDERAHRAESTTRLLRSDPRAERHLRRRL
jgi:SAM-dependent methyltransferase